jgi:type II pantothenate kinase
MRKLQADHKQDNGTTQDELCVMATGGGAFKYYDRITEALGVKVIREDEMECLIIGMLPASRRTRDVLLTSMRRP